MNITYCWSIYLTLLLLAPCLQAEEGPNEARSVMAQSLASDDGFESSISHYVMELSDRSGRRSSRRLEVRTLEGTPHQPERSIILIHEPRDISGTALLSHSRGVKDDLQWLYLPSLRRTKRISGANRGAPFIGSEFAFEDLAPQELEKYEYIWVGVDQCAGLSCTVIRRTPNAKNSAYSHQLVWIDSRDFQVRRIEFFNRAGQHQKTLTLNKYVHHRESYWRAHSLEMVNHLNGKSTSLEVTAYEFETGLDSNSFEKPALARLDR